MIPRSHADDFYFFLLSLSSSEARASRNHFDFDSGLSWIMAQSDGYFSVH